MENSVKPWKWTRVFAVGLTLSVALFCAFGAISPHLPIEPWQASLAGGLLMASFYGNSQGLANCMASNARMAHARGKGFELTTWFFLVLFIGFGLLSMAGLHNAWDYVRNNGNDMSLAPDWLIKPLFLFVAFSEPAMNWGITSLKALAKAEEAEDDARVANLAAERESRLREAEERRRGFSTVGALGAAAMIATASPTVARAEIPMAQIAPANGEEAAHKAHGWKGPKNQELWERVKACHARGGKPADAIAETNAPTTTVYRWWKILEGDSRVALAG